MALLALAYPTVRKEDWAWMQAIRQVHDQRYYGVVDPHFTLVFPVFKLAVEPFVAHVKRQLAGRRRFPFVVRCATVVQDLLSPAAHVFLVPDEGNSELVKLHDALYTDLLQPELRLDIPYIPHIGVATKADLAACKILADELNAQEFCIRGVIERLDIVSYEQNRVETLTRIELML
jgi:hypothetical protein